MRTCTECFRQVGSDLDGACPCPGGRNCVTYRLTKFSVERDTAHHRSDRATRELEEARTELASLKDQLADVTHRYREECKEAEETRQFLKTLIDTLSMHTAGTEGGPLTNPLEMISRLAFLANKAQVAQSNTEKVLSKKITEINSTLEANGIFGPVEGGVKHLVKQLQKLKDVRTELADANASVGSLREERSRLRKLFTDIGMTAETPLEDCLAALLRRRDALYYDLQGYKRETKSNPTRLEIAARILVRDPHVGSPASAVALADKLIKAEQEFDKDKG